MATACAKKTCNLPPATCNPRARSQGSTESRPTVNYSWLGGYRPKGLAQDIGYWSNREA